ncbi:YjbF family lipoprotein [SAR116 cluster bacterium]|nr:YjbF family lipoprotein [SAR116 cluster bacterium]
MEIIKSCLILLSLILFCSCSSNQSLNDINKKISTLNSMSNEKPIKSFTREMLKHINYPLIEVKTNGVLIQALMLPISQRDNYSYYSSGSGQTIVFNGAIISKTNGININLISVELEQQQYLSSLIYPQKPLLASKKIYSYLTADNKINIKEFFCKYKFGEKETINIVGIEFDLVRFIEKCKNDKSSFTNIYWLDENGFIWKSNQWLNDEVEAKITIINP